ncbi:MAG: squalene/phytoene synthase family protein [Sedimentitalea sp.]
MIFDADLTACAALVEKADPNRFLATMAAPVQARPVLFALFALNVEVARAPWVTQEPMIAEMRLQWWRDALEEIATGKTPRRHEVVSPLARLISPETARDLDQLVAARRWDIYKDPFEDEAHFQRYIEQTSGALLWAAGRSLGATQPVVFNDLGYASGLANWFQACPELERRGRIPLLDGRSQAIRVLAQSGLDRLNRARAARADIPHTARPATFTAWQTHALLKQAIKSPNDVAADALGQNQAQKRLSLIWASATGRF